MTPPAPADGIFELGGAPAHHPRDLPDLRDAIRAAAAARAPLRIVGAGRWLDAGRPVRADRSIHLDRLTGIVEYVPGDLTMTAQGGTPLAVLQAAARAEGQFLPLDPWGGDRGTLGATLATATAGPLSSAMGLPRDLALGIAFVSGTGELIRGGGRVVKNVAGFDLVRLLVGAWGTLGIIVEATVRLRALPERDLSLALLLPTNTDISSWLARLRAARVAPAAMELLDPPTARAVGIVTESDVLLLRLAGNASAVAAERTTLARFGELIELEEGCWERLRRDIPDAGAVIRWSAPLTHLDRLWIAARTLSRAISQGTDRPPLPTSAPPMVSASVGRGVVRIQLPRLADSTLLELLRQTTPAGTTLRAERLPPALWRPLAPGTMAHPLSRGVRHAFDPCRILNPGIHGDEQPGVAHVSDAGTPSSTGSGGS